jgi:UDP-N-acetylmuramoylalanine--D-glutamate ligase
MSLDSDLQKIKCLALAVSGTNGKSTTAALIERMLRLNDRRTVVCGVQARALDSVVDQTGNLDFIILQLEAEQIRTATTFRPAVAVLLNVAPDQLENFASPDETARAYAPLFGNQQFFDWAIVQSQALIKLKESGVALPAKTITFSASDSSADLILDRGLLVSRIPNWAGPLLDLDHCLLHGPHNAENLLATLAVGHVLRLSLEGMVDSLKTYRGGGHRCELVAEINGVQFIDDSKACNLDAMENALRAVRGGPNGEPNVWLIAGGADPGLDFHAAAPLLSRKVKGAFLLGKVAQKIRAAWGLFTPCMLASSLLEAVAEAARNATSGDVILLSPACSGLDQFRNYQHRGEVFCEAVKSIGRGLVASSPYMHGVPPLA